MRQEQPASFEQQLRDHWRPIRDEGVALPHDEFQPWPLYGAYHGDWLVFPLHLRSWPAGLRVDFDANQRRCPYTSALMRRLGAYDFGFSRMESGCHILPHRDAPDPGVLRLHLGLVCPGGAYLQVGAEVHEWFEGQTLVVDGQREHKARNLGQQGRLILIADFDATDGEQSLAGG